MKVCVPTMGNRGLDELVSQHFGRGETFTFVDTETGTVRVIDNTGEHHSGALTPAQIIAQEGAEVVLCSGLGRRAIGIFEENGIEVFIGAGGTVRDAISAWKSGSLEEATDANACKEHRH
ncbi:MAG: NifB/NifX family molybdenum-iron cluster-binding protein [bacterium]